MSWKGGNVETKQEKMTIICQLSKEKVKGMLKIIPKKVVYSTARTMCKMLGGTMPLPKEDNNFLESISQYVTSNIIASCNNIWLPIIQVNNCGGLCLSAYYFCIYRRFSIVSVLN